jgi:hypothetical protein
MIKYEEKLKEPKVLEALREAGIPVVDDWDEFYPPDKIYGNIMINSESILNAINSDKSNSELSFIKDDIDNFFSFIFFKTKADPKLGYIEISIRYDNKNLVSRFIQLGKINQNEPTLFKNLMMLSEGAVINLMTLPLTKDYIDLLKIKEEKCIEAIKEKFNYAYTIDGEKEMAENRRKAYLELLDNSNPRLAKLIKEIVQ